jgi:hypothetical protein
MVQYMPVISIKPKVAVEWLAFLLRLRETPDSNLGPEIGYPE